MATLKINLAVIVALAACCSLCGAYEQNPGGSGLPAAVSGASPVPQSVNPGNQRQLDELTGQLSKKRAVFIGEIHDRLEHHQNQLRVIQSMYARNPDLAIGVEYFEKPFQSFLDEYIAGSIDEREMLRSTEYFKRWQVDYRLMQPIFAFAREKHIPVLALNVPDEIHNKVFRKGMKSLDPSELAQTPSDMQPASEHYLQRLRTIYNSHPPSNDFGTFVEGVLLWDETMADTAARYLKTHPRSRIVVLAGMVHVMYGDGIPERVNRRLGGNYSAVIINGNDFGDYPGVADYQLTTGGGAGLPKPGKLGVSIIDDSRAGSSGGVLISGLTTGSAAQEAGIALGDRIVGLNGTKVSNVLELKSIMFDKQPGERMRVMVQRGMDTRKELQFEVVLR